MGLRSFFLIFSKGSSPSFFSTFFFLKSANSFGFFTDSCDPAFFFSFFLILNKLSLFSAPFFSLFLEAFLFFFLFFFWFFFLFFFKSFISCFLALSNSDNCAACPSSDTKRLSPSFFSTLFPPLPPNRYHLKFRE